MNRWRYSFQRLPVVVRWLMGVQATVYLVMLLLQDSETAGTLMSYAMLFPEKLVQGWLWQLFSYPVVHTSRDIIGILVGLAILWSLGGLFGRRWRPRHFLFFYFACGVGGGLVATAAYHAFPGTFSARVGGATPSSLGLLTAYWMVFGKEWIRFLSTKPFQARWLYYAVVFLQVLFFISGTNPDLGANLGGALTGWFLVTGRWRPRKMKGWLTGVISDVRRARSKRRFRVVHRDGAVSVV